MSNMQVEADLTAIELMRQTLSSSQFFRETPVYDEDNYDPGYLDEFEAAEKTAEETAIESAMEAKITAINGYLGRVEGEDITLAVYWLVSTLASRLASARMMLLKQKLGHFPDTGEMMADLDEDEMGALE